MERGFQLQQVGGAHHAAELAKGISAPQSRVVVALAVDQNAQCRVVRRISLEGQALAVLEQDQLAVLVEGQREPVIQAHHVRTAAQVQADAVGQRGEGDVLHAAVAGGGAEAERAVGLEGGGAVQLQRGGDAGHAMYLLHAVQTQPVGARTGEDQLIIITAAKVQAADALGRVQQGDHIIAAAAAHVFDVAQHVGACVAEGDRLDPRGALVEGVLAAIGEAGAVLDVLGLRCSHDIPFSLVARAGRAMDGARSRAARRG